SLPGILAAFIEPFAGVLGNVWKRRILILGGGLVFTASLILTAVSRSFAPLLISFILFYPASGAFVSLSQAALMDSAPERHEQNMARWTLAGSIGNVMGPLLLGVFVFFGLGWRGSYASLAVLAGICLVAAIRLTPRDPDGLPRIPSFSSVWEGFREAFQALKRREVWRWLILLEFSDLMMDVLLGFLALYFVDVAGVSETQAGIAVTIWLAMGLVTDFLFIPYIDRQPDSVKFLRRAGGLAVIAYTIFMLVPGFLPKLLAVVVVSLSTTGWYPVLQGRLYSELPGQSSLMLVVGAVTMPLGKLLPFMIGLLADSFGLGTAMWLLLLGPAALIIGLPRSAQTQETT
ncbi:MAG TPA: MFS transporter, partial [Anaerolineales bacterium]